MGARGKHIVLIGLRRSGKTTVGRLLADRLGFPFADLDEAVALREGRAVGAILRDLGERAFREIERQTLEGLVSAWNGAEETRVLATGGGTAEDPASHVHLRSLGTILYLRAHPEVLKLRHALEVNPSQRPLLAGGNAAEEGEILFRRRDPIYCALADRTLDAEASVSEVLSRCLSAIGEVS